MSAYPASFENKTQHIVMYVMMSWPTIFSIAYY